MLTVCLPHRASDCLFTVFVHVLFFSPRRVAKHTCVFGTRERKIIQIHCIRLFDYFAAVIATSTAATVVTSLAAVFFFFSFFHDTLQVINRLFFIMLPIVVFTFSFDYFCSWLLILSLSLSLSFSPLDLIFD